MARNLDDGMVEEKRKGKVKERKVIYNFHLYILRNRYSGNSADKG
jgi:hypothetical protein